MSCRVKMVSQRNGRRILARPQGFTLVELVLATMISAMVIGIFSVALSLSLRVWERQQNREPSDLPSLLELLKWQLAEFEPILIRDGGRQYSIFQGDGNSLAFATDYSVRAISKGIPVIARYVFVPGRGELYYAEMPLDPYHPEAIRRFLQMNPGDTRAWPRFYLIQVGDFALSYAGEEAGGTVPSIEEGSGIPSAVMVKCAAPENTASFSAALPVNSPFAKLTLDSNASKTGLKAPVPRRRKAR
jgi:hypothetical protein